jgi:hypothetical protein
MVLRNGNGYYDKFLCTRAMKEGKNVKPTVIPSKSHSVAEFLSWLLSIYVRGNIDYIAICILQCAICILQKSLGNIVLHSKSF